MSTAFDFFDSCTTGEGTLSPAGELVRWAVGTWCMGTCNVPILVSIYIYIGEWVGRETADTSD